MRKLAKISMLASLGVFLLSVSSCSPEHLFPSDVANGIARLSVNNLGKLVQAITEAKTANQPAECRFDQLAVVKDKTEIRHLANGYGEVVWKFDECVFDFGALGTSHISKGKNGPVTTTFFGKVILSGTRTMTGVVTETEQFPIIPSGRNGVRFDFTRALFRNYFVKSSLQSKAMTIESGSASFEAIVHLAKHSESKLCEIPLPNLTINHVRYSPQVGDAETVVSLPGAIGVFQAHIQGSDLSAQVGIHGEAENSLVGNINVWGKTIQVPTDSSFLELDFSAAAYKQSFEQIPYLQKPLDAVCSFEPEAASSIARLTVLNIANFLRAAVIQNLSDTANNPLCRLGSLSHAPKEIKWLDKPQAELTRVFEDCEFDFGPQGTLFNFSDDANEEPTKIFGKMTVSGTRTIFGRPTKSTAFPVVPQKGEIFFRFTNVRFDGFKVEAPKSDFALGMVSGRLSLDLIVHLATKELAGKNVFSKPQENLTLKNVKYLERSELLLSLRSKRFNGDVKLSVNDSCFDAQIGQFGQLENDLSGFVNVFGEKKDIAVTDGLDPRYESLNKIERNSPPSVLNTSDSSVSSEREIRTFFADILDPPGHDKAEGESDFKRNLIKYSDVIYDIVNKPDMLLQIDLPLALEDWLKPLMIPFKGLDRETLKETLIASEDGEIENYATSLDEGIKSFKFEEIEELTHIKIPDALGKYFKRFLENVLNNYFPSQELADKKRMLASILRRTTAKSHDVDKVLAIVYASGPFFQKLMQLLGDKLEPGDNVDLLALKEGLANVKSRLPSIDPYYLRRYEKELEDKSVKIEIVRSLGAASVGEAFLANQIIKGNGTEVRKPIVVKFMRPGVRAIAEREDKFLREQARLAGGSETMIATYNEISAQIFEEMDYSEEIRKLRRGMEVYTSAKFPSIGVVRVIENFPKSPFWLAMELADGKTFRDARGLLTDSQQDKRATKLELMAKALLLDQLTKIFIEKAFFLEPDGFFHGDLHEGNIILSIAPEVYDYMDAHNISGESLNKQDIEKLIELEDADGERLIKLILIDFGNAHFLPSLHRKALFNVLIAAADISMSPTAFLIALQDLSLIKQDLDWPVLAEKIAPIIKDPLIKIQEKIGRSLDILQQNGAYVPGMVVAFYRSLAMIAESYNQLVKDAAVHEFCFGNLLLDDSLTDAIATQWKLMLYSNFSSQNWAQIIGNLPAHSLLYFSRGWWSAEAADAQEPRFCGLRY